MTFYRTGRLLFLASAALVLELTLLDLWSIGGSRPELLLSLACFAALFARDTTQGLCASWGLGLLKDAASAGPLGLHALLFLGAGWIVLQVRQILFRESPLTQAGVAFLAAAGISLLGAVFVRSGVGAIPLGVVAGRALLTALLTAAVTVPLHAALVYDRGPLR
jgi:rod shape-determining protein MreD